MRRSARPTPAFRTALVLGLLLLGPASARAQATYWPGPDAAWERRTPQAAGMDAALLAQAVAFARESESGAPRDLELAHYTGFGREPFGFAVGPFRERGPQTGVVLRHGYIVAEWGEPARVDMTFSVTKSFLSTTVGLAVDRGLIRSVHDPVASDMAPVFPAEGSADRAADAADRLAGRAGAGRAAGGAPLRLFDSEHNRAITWDHLLRQTSDWEGTLWGKPDWADRPSGEPATWLTRERSAPGTAYEYNDTRVNLLALAALNVWRRPLPEVLRELVMEPIDASPTWRWLGYDNSWVVLDGLEVQSVSGGGHWGGGMFISAFDQARFGLLTLRDGRWREREILSPEWMRMARTPTPAQPGYGFMNFFLNGGRERYPSAPEEAFAHLGAGTNMVYVDPVHDLVIVARWIDGRAADGLIQRVLASIVE